MLYLLAAAVHGCTHSSGVRAIAAEANICTRYVEIRSGGTKRGGYTYVCEKASARVEF